MGARLRHGVVASSSPCANRSACRARSWRAPAARRTSSRPSTAAWCASPVRPGSRSRTGRSSPGCSRRRRRLPICRSWSGRRPKPHPPSIRATRDRERAERLVAAGAAPQKRLDEARAAEAQAQARQGAPRRSSRSINASRSAGTPPRTTRAVRAPRADQRRHCRHARRRPGRMCRAGTSLFRVVDPSSGPRRGPHSGSGRPREAAPGTPRKSNCPAAERMPVGPPSWPGARARSAIAHVADHLRIRQPRRWRSPSGNRSSCTC